MGEVLLAIALLFSQAARISELLLVQHAICEHGALLHVSANRDPGAIVSPSGADDALWASDAAPFEHEHCDPAAILHCPEAISPFLVEPSLLYVSDAFDCALGPIARPIALLFEAPKASPPAISSLA